MAACRFCCVDLFSSFSSVWSKSAPYGFDEIDWLDTSPAGSPSKIANRSDYLRVFAEFSSQDLLPNRWVEAEEWPMSFDAWGFRVWMTLDSWFFARMAHWALLLQSCRFMHSPCFRAWWCMAGQWASAFCPVVKLATWLILPVVICLSQRLSHACLSINCLYCETANGSLNQL